MSSDQARIDSVIVATEHTLRHAMLVRALWRIAAVAAACLAIGYALDRWWEPSTNVRAIAELAGFAAIIAFAIHECRTNRRPIQRERITALIAQRAPAGGDALQAIASANSAPGDGPLAQRTRRLAVNQLRDFQPHALCRPGWKSRAALVVGAVAVALVGEASRRPGSLAAFADRIALGDSLYPRAVRLVLDTNGVRGQSAASLHVARGDDCRVRVRADLTAPHRAPAGVVAVVRSPNARQRFRLVQIGEQSHWRDPAVDQEIAVRTYELVLPDVVETVTVSIRGGDCRLPPLRIVASERPEIRQAELLATPPGYLGAATSVVAVGSVESVSEGTLVSLRATVSRPLTTAAARLAPLDGPKSALGVTHEAERVETASTAFYADGRLELELTDELGLSLAEPFSALIEVRKDERPTVELALSGVGRRVTPEARVPLRVRVVDDHAIANARLLLTCSGDAQESPGRTPAGADVSLTIDEPGLIERAEFVDLRTLFAETLPESTLVTVRLAARDHYDLGPREPSTTEPIVLRIVSAGEVLSALGDREARLGDDLLQAAEDLGRLAYRLSRDQSTAPPAAEAVLDARQTLSIVVQAEASSAASITEAEHNRIDQPTLLRRWREQLQRPLERVRSLRIATLIAALSDTTEDRAVATAQASRAADELRAIAAHIDQRQSYQELVSRARTLLREQQRINRLTAEEQRAVGGRLLCE